MMVMRGTYSLAVAGLLNILALTAFFLGNAGWLYQKRIHGDFFSLKYLSDAPIELRTQHPRDYDVSTNGNNDDDDDRTQTAQSSTTAESALRLDQQLPAYLQWEGLQNNDVSPPQDWVFQMPKFCNSNFHYNHSLHSQQRIIVHYHMQHNAGTEFYIFAKQYTPCATRACWQTSKHCMVSYNEMVEADNIRHNYRKYGVQYVSYELMLPPRFPLPFVSEDARRGLFFTTIMRDPFKRFLTYYRNHKFNPNNDNGRANSPFWFDLHGKQTFYSGDNLNIRWLAGTREQIITTDHINIAKCRLQLFDLVIVDTTYDYALKNVMCPLNNWEGKSYCNDTITNREHRTKPDPLNGTDPILIGGWIERLRPSFEIYDYARILSWKQLREWGVNDLPEMSEVPSYISTLAKYTGLEVTDAHFRKIPRVNLKNEDQFHPPVEFCNRMKSIWSSNPDEVPNAYGIGSLAGWTIQ